MAGRAACAVRVHGCAWETRRGLRFGFCADGKQRKRPTNLSASIQSMTNGARRKERSGARQAVGPDRERDDCHGRREWKLAAPAFPSCCRVEKTASGEHREKTKDGPGFRATRDRGALECGCATCHWRLVHAPRSDGHRLVRALAKHHNSVPRGVMSASETPVTTPAQTVSIGNTTTNFTNQPLAPALNLFDAALGTLESVTISHSATIQSNVTSTNLSPTSSTVITATMSGSYQIEGLNQTISQPTRMLSSAPMPAGPFGSGTDTVVFPPMVLTDSSTTTFTDASSLAFFTGSANRTAVTLTMNATATATASAPNGNLLTVASSTAASTVNVAYTYLPACPTVAGIGRIGVHHQETKLVVTFNGPVDPAKAEIPVDYAVFKNSREKIPIKSATFDPIANSVTLVPARQLNVHYHFRLSVVLPCPNEVTGDTVIVPFGGKRSLIGFHNHRGEFVSVEHGRITGFENKRGQFVPVRHGHIVRVNYDEAHAPARAERPRVGAGPLVPVRHGHIVRVNYDEAHAPARAERPRVGAGPRSAKPMRSARAGMSPRI